MLPGGREPEDAEPSLKPQFKTVEATPTYGKFTLEPLLRGFGVTLGNPIRRVLLSSLVGAAVTWVRIEDVLSEYSTIPHMKEDMLEFLQNVKSIRLRANSEMPGRLHLSSTGPGEVTAGDIVAPPEFEIVNPEMHLAYLDSREGRLRVEFNVEIGKGYVPAQHGNGLPIGTLQMDAVFSPIRKVNFTVEHTRVGQFTDYERLVIEVWSDGTIVPAEALQKASAAIMDLFALFGRAGQAEQPAALVSGVASKLPPDIYSMPIERLELSSRTFNCLKRAGINKVGEILERTRSELARIRNFGEKSFAELANRLQERNLPLPEGLIPENAGFTDENSHDREQG
ncbi:MAG: DNA-directed RNA polymerase subunit alpha [Dehalococcoidia bacterium]|nr:DNA-directed RNA polymerase subunit alpha [Dehalococcoidia bacterium]